MNVRYGAKTVQRSRELEATAAEIWSTAVTAIWETDPEAIAAVLPKPLSPAAEPLVRLTITSVSMPGYPTFGAGWFGVAARHGDVEGEYPIFMPMTTEQSVMGGRDHYGEPKKIADVWANRDGDAIDAGIACMASCVCEIHGTVTEAREPTRIEARLLVQGVAVGRDRQGSDQGSAAGLRRRPRRPGCTRPSRARSS